MVTTVPARRIVFLLALLVGAGLLLVCRGINLMGVAELNFWSALVLLGIGWNFLFVGATTLLTRTYDAHEKAKVQALNDFLIFGTVALSSFSSGALLTGFGWSMVQLAVLPFAVIATTAVLWLKLRAWRVPAAQYAGL
jgi:MFS family permease